MRPVPSLRLPLLAVAASVLISACGSPPGGPPPQQGTPVVGVITVRPQPVTLTTQLPGRTVPYLIAEVRPQVGGIVQTRQFTEGGDVKAGQTLYQIDPATYRASYASAQATLAKAQANLRTARLKADRYKELVQIKAISRRATTPPPRSARPKRMWRPARPAWRPRASIWRSPAWMRRSPAGSAAPA